jgi:hypothetical protein
MLISLMRHPVASSTVVPDRTGVEREELEEEYSGTKFRGN